MAKLFASIENEKGKRDGIGGDKSLDIDIRVGNVRIAAFTLRRGDIPETEGEGWVLYDTDDEPISWLEDEEKKGWSECNHYVTDENGLCLRCGYNTRGLTMKELKGKKHKAK